MRFVAEEDEEITALELLVGYVRSAACVKGCTLHVATLEVAAIAQHDVGRKKRASVVVAAALLPRAYAVFVIFDASRNHGPIR